MRLVAFVLYTETIICNGVSRLCIPFFSAALKPGEKKGYRPNTDSIKVGEELQKPAFAPNLDA